MFIYANSCFLSIILKEKLKSHRYRLIHHDPSKTIVNIGGTSDGVGALYRLAKEMGFETTGIVSVRAKKYGGLSKYVDQVYYIKDKLWGGFIEGTNKLSPTSKAMIDSSDLVVGIGGGEIGGDELLSGKKQGKDVIYFPAEMDHEKAIEKAKKAGRPVPKDFSGASHKRMMKSGGNFCTNELVNEAILWTLK